MRCDQVHRRERAGSDFHRAWDLFAPESRWSPGDEPSGARRQAVRLRRHDLLEALVASAWKAGTA